MWIKTTARFRFDVSDTEWDLMNDEQKVDACEQRKFRFNTEELQCYNESKMGGTTIVLKDGYSITVDMDVMQIDKIVFQNV